MNSEDSNYISYLMQLKKNPQKWNDMKRLYHLLSIIGEHPDALQILGNLQLIDRDNVQVMQKTGLNGWRMAQELIKRMEIRTTNSDELTYKFYGHYKKLTAVELDQMIDLVSDYIQRQHEIANWIEEKYGTISEAAMIQEEETTLNELEQGL